MRRLLLLRHAKSNWDQSNLDDSARPLAPRGQRAAPLLGRYISGHDLVPDLVLCSTAERARQTLELVMAEWERPAVDAAKVDMRASLYLASTGEMLAAIRRVDDAVERLMIVGHNPGMAMLAAGLVADGKPKAIKTMAAKYPTAALAVIDFEADTWKAIALATGFLRRFVRPRDLS